MEINVEKSQVLVAGSCPDMRAEISMDDHTLKQVDEFKYLGSTIAQDQRSMPEVKRRVAAAVSTLARLTVIWRDRNISKLSKLRLMKSVVMSVFLYACQTWTVTADIARKIEAFEIRCYINPLEVVDFGAPILQVHAVGQRSVTPVLINRFSQTRTFWKALDLGIAILACFVQRDVPLSQ